MYITEEALNLFSLEEPDMVNGCGSSVVSQILCWFFTLPVSADLTIVWVIHDLEYSRKNKSEKHRKQADINIIKNILILLPKKNMNWYELLYIKYIFKEVRNYGSESYWNY